jgi:Ca2+-binding RTX toxin-like protein
MKRDDGKRTNRVFSQKDAVGTEPRLNVLKGCLGLVTGFWVVSAYAQPAYSPHVVNNPTPRAEAGFGTSVAGVGDVNGDGKTDFLVGAPGQTADGNARQGRAFVLSGADRSLLYRVNNPEPQANALFGQAVAGVGDIDGDDIPDLLVGAPEQTVKGNERQGRAFVFSGADGRLLYSLDTPIPEKGAAFGTSVADADDVNGDDVPDLLVGAPGQDGPDIPGQGRAFVFSGADGRPILTLNYPRSEGGDFGRSVAGAGDVTGDGIPDFLVGMPFLGRVGRALVLSGADGSLVHVLNIDAPEERAFLGWAVAGVGDVSGDGVPDLLVGAPFLPIGEYGDFVFSGGAFVFNGATGELLYQVENSAPENFADFGFAVAGLDDVNGDGIPDLLVGAPGRETDDAPEGKVVIASGADGRELLVLRNPGRQALARFGRSVAGIGDANDDGVPDLVVGAPFQDASGNRDQGRAVLFLSGAPDSFTCLGVPATIVGTPDNDILRGTPGDDVIVGLAGNDVIDGRGGDDRICGGNGNDAIQAGAGSDRVDGGAGNDVINMVDGVRGNDTVNGGSHVSGDVCVADRGDTVRNCNP